MALVSELSESEMMKYIEDKVKRDMTNYTEKGHCIQCGMCCPDILPVTESELIAIKSYITENNISPIRHIEFDKDGQPINVNLACPFRDDMNKVCLIYPVRPLICHLFICSQTPELIAKNQIYCAKHRKKSLCVSFHETFLRDSIFAQIYASDPIFKNTAINHITFEIVEDEG